MTKSEIRKMAALDREQLSPDEIADYSRRLLEHFSTLDLLAVETVHVFLPIAEKREPDTFLIIEWLEAHHPEIKILVPRADFRTALMTQHAYPGRDGLKKNNYRILEPATEECYLGNIDMVLVPLLGFDKRGFRVGYGKGFYDRFLGSVRTRAIGLSFFGPVEVIDDIHGNDVKLDACITPGGVICF